MNSKIVIYDESQREITQKVDECTKQQLQQQVERSDSYRALVKDSW